MPPFLLKAASFLGVRGFIALSLGIALALVMWRADSISKDREKLRNDLAGERAAHAVTRQSVRTLSSQIARLMRESQERAEEYERNKKQAERNAARLAERARTSEKRISMLMSVTESGDPACRVPDELLSQLEGL